MTPETRLLHGDPAPGDPHRPTSTPLYQTATFAQEDAFEMGRYDYTRSGNPTRTVLEAQLAELDGGTRAFTFASGMAAVAATVRLLSAGDEILAGDDIYGGIYRFLTRVAERQGIAVRFVDTTSLDAVRQALSPRTRLLLLETPTNPLHRISDLAGLADLCRQHEVLLAVDSSLLSPVLQRPLELGADLVIHSATKFLSGHSDLTAGVVSTRRDDLAEELAFLQNAEGTALAPFECWLLLRGLKTLHLRVERQGDNARALAHHLHTHPLVTELLYPGLPDHPGHDLHARQCAGAGSVLSFRTGDPELSRRVARATRLFTTAVSFGCVSSFISLPGAMSHASIPQEVRASRSFPEDLVRISVGIENVADLIRDLDLAFEEARASDLAAARG